MTLSEQIKSSLTAREVVELYGYQVNRAGFAKCPFHEDKTASMKVYDGQRGFHCFGCNTGGDVIDFVIKLFNLPFKDAITRISTDFGLHLTADTMTRAEISERAKAAEKAKQDLEAYHAEYDRKCDEHYRLWWAKMHKYPKSPDEPLDDEYVEALLKLPYLQYWFSENPYDRR